MAESIGLASGLLTLTIFAFNSSIALSDTIQSYKSHPQRVRDTISELDALGGVLHSLTETVRSGSEADFAQLRLPLWRCGTACGEFKQEIEKCSSRSGSDKTSFRDWAKLRYMDGNIDVFRQQLAGYKGTINIALTEANLRKSSVTLEKLEQYKDLINSATADLEAHLQHIDEKLESVFARTLAESDSDKAELQQAKEEQASTLQCLQICGQLSEHISQIQDHVLQREDASSPTASRLYPETVIHKGLQDCRDQLDLTKTKLEGNFRGLLDRLTAKSQSNMTPEETADLVRLRDEWDSVRNCIDICSNAHNHLKDNISNIENHWEGDETVQFLVSTNDKTIHGKNRGSGRRGRQIGGHLNDESLQQLSRDIASISMPLSEVKSPIITEATKDLQASRFNADFTERHGKGSTLYPSSKTNIPSERR